MIYLHMMVNVIFAIKMDINQKKKKDVQNIINQFVEKMMLLMIIFVF